MKTTRIMFRLATCMSAVLLVTSCDLLGENQQDDASAQIALSPPAWVLGTWENQSTGDVLQFTSTDVVLNGTSVTSWASSNNQSVSDRYSNDPDDGRFSNWYAYASGAPGSDFHNQYQFSMFEWTDAPGQARVMVQPSYANLQSGDFVQTQ